VKGSCLVSLDDGTERDDVLLDLPEMALYVPPLVWATEKEFSGDAVLMVLASDVYDTAEYVRDYDEFLRVAKA